MPRYVPKHLGARRRRRRRTRHPLLGLILLAPMLATLIACRVATEPAQHPTAEVVLTSTYLPLETPAPTPIPTPTPTPTPALVEEDPLPVYLYLPEVPLDADLQIDMQVACEEYGVPFTMALAVADWETRGSFDMDAVGALGEVGIMQLLPGPGGAYHAELEQGCGWDPTTPTGNIYCGCYLLGKYMDKYEGDWHKALMAYNCGETGARKQWAAGYTNSGYSRAVEESAEKWQSVIDQTEN